MKTYLSFFVILTITIIFYSCKTETLEQKGSPKYISEVNEWHQKRIERLKDQNGWLTVVGLYWLEEGENSYGSDKDNNIVFPENTPGKIGTITLLDTILTLNVINSIIVTNNGKSVKEIVLQHDLTGDPTILEYNTLRWYIIKRDEKYGIRLRNTDAPLRKEFKVVERFPVNNDWQIEAKFERYQPPKIISLPTQLGTVLEEKSPGAAVFTVDGKEYKLDAIDTGERFWFIFADETNGKETYGAGRYMYMDKPDSTGKMIIDFNYAYNPPCVFTKYATCSFAPKQNHLRLRVTAGEKNWKGKY